VIGSETGSETSSVRDLETGSEIASENKQSKHKDRNLTSFKTEIVAT
jgi:hypothetical protein